MPCFNINRVDRYSIAEFEKLSEALQRKLIIGVLKSEDNQIALPFVVAVAKKKGLDQLAKAREVENLN